MRCPFRRGYRVCLGGSFRRMRRGYIFFIQRWLIRLSTRGLVHLINFSFFSFFPPGVCVCCPGDGLHVEFLFSFLNEKEKNDQIGGKKENERRKESWQVVLSVFMIPCKIPLCPPLNSCEKKLNSVFPLSPRFIRLFLFWRTLGSKKTPFL